MSGLFISLEGVEGCGKSTQAELLAQWLEERGHAVERAREPGGTPVGEAIRNILLDPENSAMVPRAELLLYEAARAQHVAERIRPALERGAIVVCDRFTDSTTAYQGAGRGLGREVIEELHAVAAEGLKPDLTVLIDLPVAEGLARAARVKARDRIEHEAAAFHERVRQAFLEGASREPARVKIVDGLAPLEQVRDAIRAQVGPFLASRELLSNTDGMTPPA